MSHWIIDYFRNCWNQGAEQADKVKDKQKKTIKKIRGKKDEDDV